MINLKEKRIKNLMMKFDNLEKKFDRKIQSLQEERTKKLDEIVERGRRNLKEHDIAFKLLKIQAEARAKELGNNEADFDGEEGKEFTKGLKKEREAIIKRHKDRDKLIVAEYAETLTKYNRELKKLAEEEKEKTEKVLKELNLVAGTNLFLIRGNISYETKNWKELMNQEGGF